MSNSWVKIEKPEVVNFTDIVSEQVAINLQSKEQKKYGALNIQNENSQSEAAQAQVGITDIPEHVLRAISQNDHVESDAAIAKMLQIQFDKDYDNMLKMTENKYNGISKVSISFQNYRREPQNSDFESDLEDDYIEDILDKRDWDRFDTLQREIDSIPACGYKNTPKGMITKHDLVNSGRKNACKLLSFPPDFHTGDGEDFDLKISNNVFNSLKLYSKNEQARKHKTQDKKEDSATSEFGVDEFTRVLLYKMIANQILQKVNGVISVGKEAVIIHADPDPSYPKAQEPMPEECVLKVFKTILSEFKQRDKYIQDDYRFKDRIAGKQTTRRNINLWAEKEMANLIRLRKAGIKCPSVVARKTHVLVMSFIGESHMPAPKLKDANLKPADFIIAYDQVVEAMKVMYRDANLIHADLSEYNILWHDGDCYFIDVSQSIEPSHENSFYFLYRDCENVTTFFKKKGNIEVLSVDELFETITGFDFKDRIKMWELQEYLKIKPHTIDKPGVESSFNFDSTWEKSQADPLRNIHEIQQPNGAQQA